MPARRPVVVDGVQVGGRSGHRGEALVGENFGDSPKVARIDEHVDVSFGETECVSVAQKRPINVGGRQCLEEMFESRQEDSRFRPAGVPAHGLRSPR